MFGFFIAAGNVRIANDMDSRFGGDETRMRQFPAD